jgi:ribosomal protein L7/L12
MYITNAHLSQVVNQFNTRGQYVTEQRQFNAESAESTVFLSHKHDEKALLLKVKTLLENLGIKVYVDWMERNMQHPTNADTANELKKQINEQNKFILIASESAIASPWCNWELGIADTLKHANGQIAILPIEDTSKKWYHNEYLQIYPHIEYFDGTQINTTGKFITHGYYVVFPLINGTRTYVPFTEWLRKGMPRRVLL